MLRLVNDFKTQQFINQHWVRTIPNIKLCYIIRGVRRRTLLEEFASITPLSPSPPCSTPRHCCLPEVGAKRIFCNYTVKPAWRSIEKKLISNPIKCVKISLSLCPAFCILAIFLLCTIWIRDRPKPCCTHNTLFFLLPRHTLHYIHSYLFTLIYPALIRFILLHSQLVPLYEFGFKSNIVTFYRC